VCPAGWHLPDTTEWNALKKFVADSLFKGNTDSVSFALKSTSGWDNDGNGFDPFGFSMLPSGRRYYVDGGSFNGLLNTAFFWGPLEYSATYAYFFDGGGCAIFKHDKNVARSVRCVKD
jgi:uncharacterized protein (TIGR02145 family)